MLTATQQYTRLYLSNFNLVAIVLLFNLFLTYQGIPQDVQTAKGLIMDACTTIEVETTEFLSLPQRISESSNQLIQHDIQSVVNTSTSIVAGILDLIGDAAVILTSLYRSLLQCTVSSVIDAAIYLLKQYTQDLQNGIETAVNGGVTATNAVVSAGTDAVNAVGHIFDFLKPNKQNVVKAPVIAPFKLPVNLANLVSTLPDNYAKFVDSEFDTLVQSPFITAANEIRDIGNGLSVANLNILPVLSIAPVQFCNRFDLTPIDALGNYASWGTLGAMILITVAALIATAANAYVLKKEHDMAKGFASLLFQGPNDMEQVIPTQYTNANLFTIELATRLTSAANGSLRRERYKRYLVYVLYKPAILCVAIGLLGSMASAIQLGSIQAARREILPASDSAFVQFMTKTNTDLNATIAQAFDDYLLSANTALSNAETSINGQLFRPITNFFDQATVVITDIMNKSSDFLENTLHLSVFGPLVPEMFQCVIVSKVNRVLNALTFLKVIQIRLPRLSDEKLLRAVGDYSHLFQNAVAKVIGSDGVLENLLAKWEERTMKQLYLALFTFGYGLSCWVLGIFLV